MGKASSGAKVSDRISALPDALVCHILSCLPTVDAVRTTVLSTRWNRKWTLVPNLDFYELNWRSCGRFMTFVDRVLFFRDSSEIQKLCLDCSDSDFDFARVDSWICTAIWCNVVELDLCVGLAGCLRTFELPQILFTSKTLKVLRLLSNFITNPPPPPTVCFPSLKVLVVHVYLPQDDNTPLEKLFSNCPLLEQLTVEGVLGSGKVIDINISASELKMVEIKLILEYDDMDDRYHFSINAPKLENFDLHVDDLSAFSFEINANSHFKVNIDLKYYYEKQHDDRIALLEAISNVKHLSLTTPVTQGVLPAFENLNHLELALIDSNCWGFLYNFLKRSPNLEYLVIKQFTQRYEFNPPEVVPVCILSHLKAITIKGFKGKQFEMMVAKYLLKHCEVLNKMTIFTRSTGSASLPDAEEKSLYKEFLMFERGSKSCQVEIFN